MDPDLQEQFDLCPHCLSVRLQIFKSVRLQIFKSVHTVCL